MKIGNVLKICGYDYALTMSKPGKGLFDEQGAKVDNIGDCEAGTQEIRISGEIAQENQLSTILHESIHAIDTILQLGIDEENTRRLEAGLHSFLKDNPDICKAYLELGK